MEDRCVDKVQAQRDNNVQCLHPLTSVWSCPVVGGKSKMKFRDDGIAKEHASGPLQTVVVGNASTSGKLEGD